jgi:two-component system, NtrC family, sensor histidine kinase HydH
MPLDSLMSKLTEKRKNTFAIPPYIIIGAVFVLLPIVIFITYQNIKSQDSHVHQLFLEKGAALIRSFEAGTRAGMRGRLWGNRKLQQLLEETARQPDISYLIVTDEKGRIIAHNNQSKIHRILDQPIDYSSIINSKQLVWRILELGNDKNIFEVAREFKPIGSSGNPEMEGRMRGYMGGRDHPPESSVGGKQVIFVGLDMGLLEKTNKATAINSILTGVLLFLAGFGGIILLFLFQNYQTAKTSLSRIKAFSDNLVDNMPIGLLALDDQKLISSMNATAGEVLGVSPQEVIGKTISEVLPLQLLQSLDKTDETRRIIGEEVECEIEPGRIIPMEISASAIFDNDNKLISYALLLKDLSEIHSLRKEVARSQRLASVGNLAAGVAHEIRNPLSTIKGFATYFRERYKEVPKDQQTATIMINEVDRLDRVVGQLLELARPVRIMPELTDIGQFIQNSMHLINPAAAEKGISIKTHIPDKHCEIGLDRDKISQVLLNLYLNAIDAMTEGGALEIGLEYSETGDSAEITVSDNGKGIPKDDLSKVFDPYFTTKPTGTGLGLAIVHNILEAHQGRISVENRSIKGTKFTMIIPNLDQEIINGK